MPNPKCLLINSDVMEGLRTLPDESVHCCVTSPPYWGLRDYGTAQWEGGDLGCTHICGGQVQDNKAPGAISSGVRPGCDSSICKQCGAIRVDNQIGLEKTPEEYIEKMVAVFREVRRVLRKDGTLWLNMGDSYVCHPPGKCIDPFASSGLTRDKKGHKEKVREMCRLRPPRDLNGLKPKDLCMIPARLALALQADGWWLRSDIIWHKPNPMPESCTDRPTTAHEHIFLLTKSARYFYDAEAVREGLVCPPHAPGNKKLDDSRNDHNRMDKIWGSPNGRNLRSVWTLATEPFPEAHFATFPTSIPERCIKAGTSEKGVCPKCGGPWERVVEKSGGTTGKSWHDHGDDLGRGMSSPGCSGLGNKRDDKGQNYHATTIGWRSTCKCSESNPIPATVLDLFSGAATTLMVAAKLGRDAVGIELNPDYVAMSVKRLKRELGMWAEVKVAKP